MIVSKCGVIQSVGVPIEKADGWLKDVLNKCKLIEPDYMPVTEVTEYAGKVFIVLWCPGGSARPYSSPKTMGGKSERVRWVRRLASTVQPTPDEERDLYTLANNVPFDDRPNHAAQLSDLNIMLIKSYLHEVGSSLYDRADDMDFAELCQDMHIAAGPAEYVRPLNVGLMFFSPSPEKWFPYAQIDVVEFPDGEGGDRLIEHTFKGPLHNQLQDAMRYLTNNVVAEEVVKSDDGSPSERSYNYPPDALKEALANAVYHKGYDQREPVEVRVLPDRIEILSHPGADRSITLEGLKNYRMACRRYRNRRVGEFLKELGLTEGRNTGVHRMLRAMRENGSPDPVFETDEDRLYFMVTLPKRPSAEARNRKPASGTHSEMTGQRREAILAYLAENPGASRTEVAQTLGIASATLARDINALKAEGRLERDGRFGAWRVR